MKVAYLHCADNSTRPVCRPSQREREILGGTELNARLSSDKLLPCKPLTSSPCSRCSSGEIPWYDAVIIELTRPPQKVYNPISQHA
jgi:hypothetical protein